MTILRFFIGNPALPNAPARVKTFHFILETRNAPKISGSGWNRMEPVERVWKSRSPRPSFFPSMVSLEEADNVQSEREKKINPRPDRSGRGRMKDLNHDLSG
jgi:hypothetical protein